MTSIARHLFLGSIALCSCDDVPPSPVQERVQAIAVQQATSMATSAPASTPAPVHVEATNRELCDRKYGADKAAPKIAALGKTPLKGATWINLWAAWCKPCVAEIPELKAWAEEGGYALQFVSLDDDEREWKQGVEKLGLGGSLWLGPGKSRTAWLKPVGFLDVPNLPGQVIVDGEKRLRCFRSGAIEAGEKASWLAFMKSL